MTDLENISVGKLFSLQVKEFDAYNDLLTNLNGKNEALGKTGKDIYELPFSSVSHLKNFFQSPTYSGFAYVYNMIFGIEKETFQKMNVIEFYQSFNWLQNEIIELVEGEKRLESKPDAKWKEAGIEQLGIFGEMNTLIEIGKAYSTPPQEVEKWSYNLVFSLAYYNKISSDINKKYSELNMPKNGNS